MRALRIHAGSYVDEIEVEGLIDLQKAVGGHIELVPTLREDIELFVNDFGLIAGLPVSMELSQRLSDIYGEGIVIHGDAVLVGTDGQGEVIDLPEDITADTVLHGHALESA